MRIRTTAAGMSGNSATEPITKGESAAYPFEEVAVSAAKQITEIEEAHHIAVTAAKTRA